MSYSKLKPYNYIGMQSGRLSKFGVKLSAREYFSFAARYLKDNQILQESIFEKPYLQSSRPQMHQDWSIPDWPTATPDIGPGGEIQYRKHTFIFNEGMCSISLMGDQDCSEQVQVSTWLGAAPLFTTSVRDIEFKATSSDESLARIVSQDTDSLGNATFIVQLADEGEGEAEICVDATLRTGKLLKKLVYNVPSEIDGVPVMPGWIPDLRYAMNRWMPVSEEYVSPDWDCGCIVIIIDCCGVGEIAYDEDVSGDTVGDNDSVLIAIQDTGNSGPYTYTVTGEDFWIDSGRTKKSFSTDSTNIYIFTGPDSCGGCTIAIENCDASSQTSGGVRSTNGAWKPGAPECIVSGPATYGSCRACLTQYYCDATKIQGIYKQFQRVGIDQFGGGDATPCLTGYLCSDILCNVYWVNDAPFDCLWTNPPPVDQHIYLMNYGLSYQEWEC